MRGALAILSVVLASQAVPALAEQKLSPAKQMVAAVADHDVNTLSELAPLGLAQIKGRSLVPFSYDDLFQTLGRCTLSSVDETSSALSDGAARWACPSEASEFGKCYDRGYGLRIGVRSEGKYLALSNGDRYSAERCGPMKTAPTPPMGKAN